MKLFLAGLMMSLTLGLASFVATKPVYAVDVFPVCQAGQASQSEICKSTDKQTALFGKNSVWNKVLNILTFVIGAIAVLMMIIGGLRYTLSGGDSSAISSAKNTIIYAAVGLVIASLANAIVNFVLTNI